MIGEDPPLDARLQAESLERIESAIAFYTLSMQRSVHMDMAHAESEAEVERHLRTLAGKEQPLNDLLDARDCLFDGTQIDATDQRTNAVFRAFGLTQRECRAIRLFYVMGQAQRRSPRELAAELRVPEQELAAYVGRITAKVPQVRFPSKPSVSGTS